MSLSDMLHPKLVELGSVKIGTLGDQRSSRSGGSYRVPKKLNHFWITTRLRGDDGLLKADDVLMESLKAEYADPDGQLRRIPIVLLSDTISDVLRSAWVHYRGKMCYARSDGKTLWKYRDMKTGEILTPPEELPWNSRYETERYNGAPLFRKHTTLEFVIAAQDARWGGVYRFRTTSIISGDQLYGSLLHLKRLTGGVLSGMPLMLVLRPILVAPDGKPTTVYVVHVELHGKDMMALQKMALDISRFRKEHRLEMQALRREMLLLSHDPGEDEDEEVQAEVQQEFHPEAEDPNQGFLDAFAARVAGCNTEEEINELAGLVETLNPPLKPDQLSECRLYLSRRRDVITSTIYEEDGNAD